MTTVYRTIDDLWSATIQKLFDGGVEIESRVGKVKEILSYSVTLSHVEQTFLLNKRRRLSPAYASAEFLWYLSATRSIEMIKAYAPQYEKYAENGVAHGAYGYRIDNNAKRNQLNLLIEHLQQSSKSRQAIITLWNANDLWHSVEDKRKDLPCTLSLQFLIRYGKLHLITTMRSNDAWLGLPYDVYAFTCLQWLVASILGIKPGSYTHQTGSMHVYEKNWSAAKEALESKYYLPEYLRLEHTWIQTLLYGTRWQKDVKCAIQNEQAIRTTNVMSENYLQPVNGVLFDSVMCCATKWCRTRKPNSLVLQEALKNAKK